MSFTVSEVAAAYRPARATGSTQAPCRAPGETLVECLVRRNQRNAVLASDRLAPRVLQDIQDERGGRWFCEVPIEASMPRHLDVGRAAVSGYSYQEDVRTKRESPYILRHPVPCYARQSDVDDCRCRAPLCHLCDSAGSVMAYKNFMAVQAQKRRETFGRVFLVLADENPPNVLGTQFHPLCAR